jgi:hypothetical protein
MSSSSGMLPFLKILSLVSNRSGVGRRTWTNRDLLSVQPQQRYLASGRPILEPYKASNHLPFKCLHREQDISPPLLHEGAKIYSFWVGFLAKRNPRRWTSTAVLVSRALPLPLIRAFLNTCFIDLVIPKPNAEESAIALRDRAAEVDNLATYNFFALDSLGGVPRVHHQL